MNQNSNINETITIKTKDNKFYKLSSFSFLCALIMVFYTFISEGDGGGVLVAITVGLFLCIPQCILFTLSLLKKENLFIVNIILIISGFIATLIMMNMVNYKFNIFVILNILILIILLWYIIKINKSKN